MSAEGEAPAAAAEQVPPQQEEAAPGAEAQPEAPAAEEQQQPAAAAAGGEAQQQPQEQQQPAAAEGAQPQGGAEGTAPAAHEQQPQGEGEGAQDPAQQQTAYAEAARQAQELASKFSTDGKRKLEEGAGEEGAPDGKRQEMEGGGGDPSGLQGVTTTGLAGETTFTIQAGHDQVGRIIGKAGVTIKELEGRTGVRVQVDHKAESEFKPVHLIGSAPAVDACKALLAEVLSNDGPRGPGSALGETSKQISCPPGIVGRIIGRGGETIRSLQSGSGAHILVDQNFPPEVNREITISGKADCVDRAYRMVSDLINGDPGTAQQVIQRVLGSSGVGLTKSVECPKSIVGRVIGKSGETIKGLQRQFGTSVQIDQSCMPCRITIAGPHQSTIACERAVIDIIEDRPPMGMGMGMGMGGMPGMPMGGMPGMGGYAAPYAGGYPPAAGGFGANPYGGAAAYGAPAPFAGGYPGAANPYGAPAAGAYGAPAAGGFGAYGGAGGAAAPDPYAQYQAAAAPVAASPWQQMSDDQGRPYYYHSQTGQSQWERPVDMP